ncbi:rhodanese-like domain-containing protein [Staphylococcus agnetis]|uniref:rhodanese-like domain-containing protein n=1 Tax=Staphylococcus agnetis TaxID=985762 RepID=UPI000E04C251|nr:rhodanese-like domain-containing protein [Staphylococcus agnetis]SUK12829.1 rhodanese-like domain-containing protein [Staphylococcus agnetis]
MKEITTDALKSLLLSHDVVNVIDVREDEEVTMGMIPNAKHIPMNDIPNHINDFNNEETYYIVCAGGVRSAKVAEYLLDHHIDAVNIEGGMKAWGSEGLEFKRI